MYQIFYCMALRLYKWACIHKIYFPSNQQVEKDLQKLYPGENCRQACTEYYVGKLAKSIMVGVAGVFLAIVVALQAGNTKVLNQSGELIRGGYGEETVAVEVECVVDQQVQNFKIEIGAQEYDYETIISLYEEFRKELGTLILGNNDTLTEVTEDLNLWENYEGYPFEVEWQSENPDVVNSQGEIVQGYDDSKQAKITANISYEEWEWEEKFSVTVLPMSLSPEEQFREEMKQWLKQSEADTRKEKMLKLPDNWQGKKLEWKEQTENYSVLIVCFGIFVAILIFWMADKDLHDRVEKRKLQMKRDYPDIVHKMTLYLGAGITIRGAFQKLAGEYEKARGKGGRESPVYEEILHTCRELKAGVSESAAYENLGKRIGVQEYIRLCTLLIQNLKKGNSALLQRLREEAQKASEEQLRYGKQLCEEAVTKLLLPMVLMLLVVMLMIMIPAFSTMGV